MDDRVIYWDASAVIAALVDEPRTLAARRLAASPGTHLLSSLAWAETRATIARAERESKLAGALVAATDKALRAGPWRQMHASPDWELVRTLSRIWPLRGADLWHLALAKTLARELPELTFLTYDEALGKAAAGEGLKTP